MAETDNVSRTTLATKVPAHGNPSPNACDAALERPLVLTSDRNSSRLSKIDLLVERCGGQPRSLTEAGRGSNQAFANCNLAVIAMGTAGPSAGEFQATVLKLKQNN